MYRKVLKNVFVIVFLFFGIVFTAHSNIGVVGIDLCSQCKVQDESIQIIKINLVEKNINQNISIAIYDNRGSLVTSKIINSSYLRSASFQVSQGSYKVVLVNIKTTEREIHYVN